MKRTAKATWKGSGAEGSGTLTTQSGVFNDQPYSFTTRFKNEDGKQGTNPEELIAAAHAGCFAMALSFELGNVGFTPDELDTKAIVEMESDEKGGFSITNIVLDLKAKVPGIQKDQFLTVAETAKTSCPVSKALSSVAITLNAELV